MDLNDERGRMSPQICMTFAWSDNLIRNTHQQIQIHVGIDEVWQRVISEGSSEEENPYTIVVGAIGVDGWNLGDREVLEGRCQGRLVGDLSKTLQRNQYSPSILLRVTRSHLHRSKPISALSLRERPPLTPDTRFRAMSVNGRDEREEKSQGYALC